MVKRGCAAAVLLALAALAHAEMAVWAEAALSHDRAYVQETLLYTVGIFSAGNLRRVTLTPPQHPGVTLEKLDGPRTRAEEVGGKHYILSEFRYALTPLVAGSLTLGPAAIRVEPRAEASDPGVAPRGALVMPPGLVSKGGDEKPFNITTEGVYLVVFPPFREAHPWLPLRSLTLTAHWSATQVPQAGEPVRLTLEITAAGSIGSRLPSLEPHLRPADISVYPVAVDTDWAIGGQGDELRGRRIESYTLVPRREGMLSVPALRVPWWDAVGNQRAVAEVPAQTLRVGAAQGQADALEAQPMPADAVARVSWRRVLRHVVLPVAGSLALALFAGWWIMTQRAVAASRRRGLRLPREGSLKTGLSRVTRNGVWPVPEKRSVSGQPAGDTARLSSGGRRGRRMHPARRRIALWWLRVRVFWARDLSAIDRLLRGYAAVHLGMSANVPLRRIAQGLAEPPLCLDDKRLVGLFHRLEAAIYGRRRLALASWKHDLARCLACAGADCGGRRGQAPGSGLPALNP